MPQKPKSPVKSVKPLSRKSVKPLLSKKESTKPISEKDLHILTLAFENYKTVFSPSKKSSFSKLPKGIIYRFKEFIDFTINIGEYCFTLLRGSEASNEKVDIPASETEIRKVYENAGVVPIEIFDRAKFEFMSFGSNKKTRILNAYRSTSELGIWRLAYLREADCGLEKFNLDYVQGTLLHYKLQAFINEKWKDLITSTISGTNSYMRRLPDSQICKQLQYILDRVPSEATTRRIDEKSRIQKVPQFSILPIITCGDTGRYTIYQLHTHLVTLSGNIREGYEIDPETITFINEYYFIEPDEFIEAKVSMYTVIMRDRRGVPPQDLKLVYCKYYLKYGAGENKTHVHGVYGIALLPVTEDENINEFGLIQKIVSAQIIICKPLIYQEMCDPNSVDKSQSLICNENYIYIGFIYNVYPYDELGGLEHGGAESGNTGWFFDTKIQTDITNLLKSPSSVLSEKISLSLSGFAQHVTNFVTAAQSVFPFIAPSKSKEEFRPSDEAGWTKLAQKFGGGRKTYKYKYNPVTKTRKFRN